jgi:hypothetical protein
MAAFAGRKNNGTKAPSGPGPRERWKYEKQKRAVMAAGDADASLGGAQLQEAPPERALIASVNPSCTPSSTSFLSLLHESVLSLLWALGKVSAILLLMVLIDVGPRLRA